MQLKHFAKDAWHGSPESKAHRTVRTEAKRRIAKAALSRKRSILSNRTLPTPDKTRGTDYLSKDRGFKLSNRPKFSAYGFAPSGWDNLLKKNRHSRRKPRTAFY